MVVKQEFTIFNITTEVTANDISQNTTWIEEAVGDVYNINRDNVKVWTEYREVTSNQNGALDRRRLLDFSHWENLIGNGCGAYPNPDEREHGQG